VAVHVLRLPDPVRTVKDLLFEGGRFLRLHEEHVRSAGQVDARAAGQACQQEHLRLALAVVEALSDGVPESEWLKLRDREGIPDCPCQVDQDPYIKNIGPYPSRFYVYQFLFTTALPNAIFSD
jgi:hypothetical protein